MPITIDSDNEPKPNESFINEEPSFLASEPSLGGETFDEFAAKMPETANGFLDGPILTTGPETSEPSTEQPPERKRVNVSKKVRKAMDRLKKKTANLPILWFHNQAKLNPEWELDKEEKELITDAIETVFDVLDIGIEIEPLSITLTSIWWVISYPLVAFGFLFMSKKSLIMEKEQQDDDTATENAN